MTLTERMNKIENDLAEWKKDIAAAEKVAAELLKDSAKLTDNCKAIRDEGRKFRSRVDAFLAS